MSSQRFYFVLCYVVMSVSQILGAPREIIDDNLSPVYKLTYQVFLRAQNTHVCGGTLISPRAVLTAAHCLQFVEDQLQLTCRKVIVHFSSTDSLLDDSTRRVVNCRKHPKYKHDKDTYFPNDIAILVLDKKLKIDKQVMYLLLPPPNSNFDNHIGVVSGWCKSTLPDGSVQQSLFKLKTKILSQNYCQGRLGQSDSIKNSKICSLTSIEQFCICEPDSGGSLVVNNTLIGVVSFRFQCSLGYPDFFSSVNEFRVFIHETLQIIENRREERLKRKYERMKNQLALEQDEKTV